MLRLKWFLSDFGISFETLSKRLKSLHFDPKEPDTEGFSLEKLSGRVIIGQHIEKISYLHIIRLPSGASVEEPRSVFTITEFLFKSESKLAVRITNSPRRLSTFLNSVSAVCDQEFTCDSLEVDIFRWIQCIEKKFGSIRVTQFDINNVRISDSTVGRFALKGAKDVRDEAQQILVGKKYVIESARCELLISGTKVLFEIFRGGAAKFLQTPQDQFLIDFENCLLNAIP